MANKMHYRECQRLALVFLQIYHDRGRYPMPKTGHFNESFVEFLSSLFVVLFF